MDLLIKGAQNRQNVALTSMRGLERSRFLLRSELVLLTTPSELRLSRIYHVSNQDRCISKIYNEAKQMPFEQFGVVVKKYDGTDESPAESSEVGQLIVCDLKYIFDLEAAGKINLDLSEALVVFDSVTLEGLESACCEAQEGGGYSADGQSSETFLPGLSFGQVAKKCSSIVLACNPPINGLESELNCRFPIVISDNSSVLQQPRYKTFATILPRGLSNKAFRFGGIDAKISVDDKATLHKDSGVVLEQLSNQLRQGGIVVFFPSYGQMIEYHDAWKRSGLFERLNLPYGRENRGGDIFKNGLIKFTREEKSIFLVSIRYHKDEDLAEFVMAQARAVIVVGLPYPFMNDTWEARIGYNDESGNGLERLKGKDLHKYRAIEFLNRIVKRCLNESRFKDCSLFLLDEALEHDRDKLAPELGSVAVETHDEAMSRHSSIQ